MEPPASPSASEAQPDIPVGRQYELTQCRDVDLLTPAQLHMPHVLAGAFQNAGPVVERRAVEEADVHMSTEGVDVPKRGLFHARSRTAVVQELANVRPTAAHAFKPRLRHPTQLVVGPGKPEVDAVVSPDGAGEP